MATLEEKKATESKKVAAEKTGLDLLRAPFPLNQIGKLVKPTAKQTSEVKADYTKGFRCPECKGWHHPKAVHLDYVGHAALTDRLLDCDPNWNWDPFSLTPDGQPCFSNNGNGLWIKLTVCGVTRPGYGDAGNKKDKPDAIKEMIGDALRNAAMRFGAALDLWHKGDLHVDDGNDGNDGSPEPSLKEEPDPYVKMTMELFNEKASEIGKCTDSSLLNKWVDKNKPWIDSLDEGDKDKVRSELKQYYDIFKKEKTEE